MATLTTEWQMLGEKYLGNSYGNLYVRLYARYSEQDIVNNRSYVYVESRAYFTGGYIKDNQGSGYVALYGTVNGSCTYVSKGETVIATTSSWVSHADNGTLNIHGIAYLNFPNWGWSGTVDVWAAVPSIPRQARIKSVPEEFTDVDKPTVTFDNAAKGALPIQVCISWTGGDDISYRSIKNPTDTSYTFEFTEEELNKLYDATVSAGSNSIDVVFYVTTIIGGKYHGSTLRSKFTVVDCMPTLDPEVLDNGSTSTQLTDNPKVLIRHFNYPKATVNAAGLKRASIIKRTVTCGSQVRTDIDEYAQFDNVDSNEFIFTVVDNRGNTVSKTITVDMVDYVAPTCRSYITTDLASNNTADININISGKCFNGSFGAQNNVIVVEYRYKTNDENFPVDENGIDEWINIPISFIENAYSAEVKLENLDYKGTYTVQSRIRDTINYGYIYAKEEIVKIVPTFDWGEDDFNFNVRVFKEGNPMGYYPIGGIYTSTDGTNPAELFGGTWQLMRTFYGGELVAYSTTWNTVDNNTIFMKDSKNGFSDIFSGDNTSNHIVNYIPDILTKSSGTIWVQTKGIVGLVETYVELSGHSTSGCCGIWFHTNNKNELPDTVIMTGGGSLQGVHIGNGSEYSGTSSRYFYNINDTDVGTNFFVNPIWMPYGGNFQPSCSGLKSILQVKAFAKGGVTYMWKRTA